MNLVLIILNKNLLRNNYFNKIIYMLIFLQDLEGFILLTLSGMTFIIL